MDTQDRPLDEDVAELEREAQKAVDREIAARAELDAAIKNRVSVYEKIGAGADRARAFIDAYVNPAQPNPEPVAPDVAAPAPAVEPPVFTDVASAELTPVDTSGGFAETIGEGLTILASEDAPAADQTNADVQG